MYVKLMSKLAVARKKHPKDLWFYFCRFPFYPLLLSIYTILFFLVHNITQVDNHAADRLLLVFSIATLLLLILLRLVLRDFKRAGLVVFILMLIFFTYSHIRFVLLEKLPIFNKFNILLPASMILMIAAFFAAMRLSRETLSSLSIYLNGIILTLVLYQVFLLFNYEIRSNSNLRMVASRIQQSTVSIGQRNTPLPDIYFIVLDGYARADVLQSRLNLDNSPFLDALRKRNFYVATCSMSNYAQTEQSFASTLNMMYLDNIISQINSSDLNVFSFAPYIKKNPVRQYFESLGYKTIAFYTGFDWGEWTDATYFLGDPRSTTTTSIKSLIPFESIFLSRTIFAYWMDELTFLGIRKTNQPAAFTGNEVDRGITLYTLSELPVVAKLRSPKFVFAHILLPHPPYVFGPNGEEGKFSDYDDINHYYLGYRDQILFANKSILTILDAILSQSKGNAFIVLEGDHGIVEYKDGTEHMKNLSTYYFPDHNYSRLYPSITPVNSFRVILSNYFGQNYPPLKDLSYFSDLSSVKTFTLVTNICNNK
jgi:hypothetical protein